MIKEFIVWLWKKVVASRNPVDYKEMQEYYITRISFMKSDYERQIAEIKEEKKKHPENGKDLDKWQEREVINYRKLIDLNQDNRNLKEEIIFLKGEIGLLSREIDRLKNR